MAAFEVTIPAPGPWLTTNRSRGNPYARAKDVRLWREAAAWHIRAARPPRLVSPVHITATIHKPTDRAYDLDGVTPTVKACIDAARDCGVIAEDDHRHVTRLTLESAKGPRSVTLRIEEAHDA